MKSLLFLFISMTYLTTFAGFGGSGGGVKMDQAKYITVMSCSGEGEICKMIRIKKQIIENKPFIEECLVSSGEAGYKPCPTEFGVPGVFKELEDLFNKK